MVTRVLLAILVLLAIASPSFAQLDDGPPPVTVRAAWSSDAARAGDQRVLAVVLEIADGWHVNPDAARTAASLIPTSVKAAAAGDALTLGPPQFPEPHLVEVSYSLDGKPIPSYEGRTVVYVPAMVSPQAAGGGGGGGDAAVSVSVTYQACNDQMCLPPKTVTLEAPLRLVAGSTGEDLGGGEGGTEPELFATFDWSSFGEMMAGDAGGSQPIVFDAFGYSFTVDPREYGLIVVMLVAAAGGLLLNFTPCVLPVIPIKIIGLSRAAGNRARCLLLGSAMALGVVAFWMALGGLIAGAAWAVRGTGELPVIGSTNELFQYPAFNITVGLVIAAMAVGMCGLFSARLPGWVYEITPRHDGVAGSVGFGVMTAVLSTPCTAPLMGAAAAWATKQEPGVTLATFGSIGGGMALPYLVLAAFPTLVERMPRTGPASELIKQVMGLLMLAAAAYFIGVGVSTLFAPLSGDGGASSLYWWPVMGFIALAAGWLIYRTWRVSHSTVKRLAWTTIGGLAILAAGAGGVRLTDDGPIDWVKYTPERFAEELADGHVVVMDFTAEWCLNCKALEHAVLYREAVVELFEDPKVVPMKVDITSSANVAGTRKLAAMGRVAIPLLVVFAPDGSEVFKSDAYTVEQVVEAVREAKGAG